MRYLNEKSSLRFGLHSPLTVHCVSALCINQTSPISRNTSSTIKSNILPASTGQLLKRQHSSSSCMGSHDLLAWHLDLDHVNCQSSVTWGLPWWCGSVGKESACSAGDLGLIPGLGRFFGEGNGNPLQYSCLENATDRGVWWATESMGSQESDTT